MENLDVLKVDNQEHLEAFLKEFVAAARQRLDGVLKYISNNHNKTPSAMMAWAQKERAYPHMCAFSQEMVIYNLEDSGFTSNPFISDSVKKSVFTHCAASIPIDIAEDNKRIHVILDPTYTQFSVPTELYSEFGLLALHAKISPFASLMKSIQGQSLWQNIKDDGYFIVTPEKAKLYIESICPHFEISPRDAAIHLTFPPYHSGNMQHGRLRIAEKGCLGMELTNMLEQTRHSSRPQMADIINDIGSPPSP